jgi:molybdopterin-binding protein
MRGGSITCRSFGPVVSYSTGTPLWRKNYAVLSARKVVAPHSYQGSYPKSENHPAVKAMKISARNILKGKVKKITPGSVNSEVVLELPGGQEITSIITKKSVENLGLAVGKPAYAVIKSSEVMIGVD